MYATLAQITNKEDIYQAVLLGLNNIPAKEYDFGGFEFDKDNLCHAYSLKCQNVIILRLRNDPKIYELLYEEVVWSEIKEVLDGRRTQEANSRT